MWHIAGKYSPAMSKAFTKESDDEPEEDLSVLPASASLPPGTKNYMTPGGASRLRTELQELVQVERSKLTASADGEVVQLRRRLNGRIAELETIMQSAEIVPPPIGEDERKRVVFGATVTVREVRTGSEERYQIVGVDEVDFSDERVTFQAPIARALINRRLGERVRFRFPAGEEELEIIAVEYES